MPDLAPDLVSDYALIALCAAAIFVLAAIAQAVSGFGAALLAIPLLVLVIDPTTAVVTATGVSLVLSGRAWRRERAHVVVPVARRFILAGLCGMPVGLGVLLIVDERTLGLVIGILILVTVALLALGVSLPATPGVERGAGVASGLLLTSTGMNGPPLVFVLSGSGMAPRSVRATLQAVFTVQDLVAVFGFAVVGVFSMEAGVAIAAGCVGVPLGWFVGEHIFDRLSAAAFRRVVLVGLVASALTCLTQVVVAH